MIRARSRPLALAFLHVGGGESFPCCSLLGHSQVIFSETFPARLSITGGMTAPRQILPGTTYMVTRRCSERRFFLRPSAIVNQIFTYCLAYAAQETGVFSRLDLSLKSLACSGDRP